MNANRLVVRLYSVVAILAAMIYLSGVAMAQPPKKDNKHDGNQPVPEHDSFDNDGSDTFENSPTPTFTPEPPRPEKKNDKEKEQKEKKEKKDKDDGVVTIQSASPDLKYVSVVVTPVGDVAGGSGVTGQAATITVTIINANSAAAGAFRLDTWKHLPSPPNFGSIGDFSQTFAGLAGNTSLSVSYSFSMANSYGTYFPRSTVDSGSLVVETSEANNTNTGSYTLIEMATVVPPTINTVSGASVVFRGVAKPYGKKWPVNQPSAIITVPGVGTVTVPHNGTATLAGVGTFGPIVKNLIGDASLTCALAEGFGGTATVTFVCGTSTASGQLRSVCLGAITPSGTIIAAGKSLTFTVQTNPASSTWPLGAPTATLTPSAAGTLGTVGTATGSATVTFFSLSGFAGTGTIIFNYGSCSSSGTVSVQFDTTTTLSVDAPVSAFGQTIAFAATVTPATATGLVIFKNGGATLGTATLFSGVATFSTDGLGMGTHMVTAFYAGDSNHGSSMSDKLPIRVVPAPPCQCEPNDLTGPEVGEGEVHEIGELKVEARPGTCVPAPICPTIDCDSIVLWSWNGSDWSLEDLVPIGCVGLTTVSENPDCFCEVDLTGPEKTAGETHDDGTVRYHWRKGICKPPGCPEDDCHALTKWVWSEDVDDWTLDPDHGVESKFGCFRLTFQLFGTSDMVIVEMKLQSTGGSFWHNEAVTQTLTRFRLGLMRTWLSTGGSREGV